MGKFLHITGVVLGFAACGVLIIGGIAGLGETGPMVTWGIALLLSTLVAVLDGAQAFPTLGLWKFGAKFSGLSDLATFVIMAILIAAFFVSRAI